MHLSGFLAKIIVPVLVPLLITWIKDQFASSSSVATRGIVNNEEKRTEKEEKISAEAGQGTENQAVTM